MNFNPIGQCICVNDWNKQHYTLSLGVYAYNFLVSLYLSCSSRAHIPLLTFTEQDSCFYLDYLEIMCQVTNVANLLCFQILNSQFIILHSYSLSTTDYSSSIHLYQGSHQMEKPPRQMIATISQLYHSHHARLLPSFYFEFYCWTGTLH